MMLYLLLFTFLSNGEELPTTLDVGQTVWGRELALDDFPSVVEEHHYILAGMIYGSTYEIRISYLGSSRPRFWIQPLPTSSALERKLLDVEKLIIVRTNDEVCTIMVLGTRNHDALVQSISLTSAAQTSCAVRVTAFREANSLQLVAPYNIKLERMYFGQFPFAVVHMLFLVVPLVFGLNFILSTRFCGVVPEKVS